jgi:hypothetical protein
VRNFNFARFAVIAICLFSFAGLASAESRFSKVWKWSAAALVAGSTMDVASSYGYREANGLLASPNGRLSNRGTAIKLGAMAGVVGLQYYLVKKHPKLEKPFVVTNFALAGMYSTVAFRNYAVR